MDTDGLPSIDYTLRRCPAGRTAVRTITMAARVGLAAVIVLVSLACTRPPNVAALPEGANWWCYRVLGRFVDKRKEAAGMFLLGVVPPEATHGRASACYRSEERCVEARATKGTERAGTEGVVEDCARQEQAACITAKPLANSEETYSCYDGMGDCEWWRDVVAGDSAMSKDYEYISSCEWTAALP
jgi:hypothetical protein